MSQRVNEKVKDLEARISKLERAAKTLRMFESAAEMEQERAESEAEAQEILDLATEGEQGGEASTS